MNVILVVTLLALDLLFGECSAVSHQGLCSPNDPTCTDLAITGVDGCLSRDIEQAQRYNNKICAPVNFDRISSHQCYRDPKNGQQVTCPTSCEINETALWPQLSYSLIHNQLHESQKLYDVFIQWRLPSGANVSGYTLIVSREPWNCNSNLNLLCKGIELPGDSTQVKFLAPFEYHGYQQYWELRSQFYVKLLPNGWCDGPQISILVPDSCYSICPGACSICPSPKPLIPTNLDISVCQSNVAGLFVASLSWQSGRTYFSEYPNQTYYVEVFPTVPVSVEVVGSTSVVLHNLDLELNHSYKIKVFPYDCKCGFSSVKNTLIVDNSTPLCSNTNTTTTSTDYSVPTSVSSFTSLTPSPPTHTTVSTTLTPSTPIYFTNTELHSTATTNIRGTTSTEYLLPTSASSLTPLTPPLSSHITVSTTFTASTPTNTSSPTGNPPGVLGPLLAVVTSILIIVITIIIIIICCLRHQSLKFRFPPKLKNLLSPIPAPFTTDILLVYSLQTPEEEVEHILTNFAAPLQMYGIRVTFYDMVCGQVGIPEWMESAIAQSNKVFLVCNAQFKKEWDDPSEATLEGNLVHILKQNFFAHIRTSSDYMSKYALLFLKADLMKSKSSFVSVYLRNLQRFVVDPEEPAALEQVVKFITNTKSYVIHVEDEN